jgi:O-antigen ligase
LHATLNHSKRKPDILLKGLLFFAVSSICLTIMYLFNYGTSYYNFANRITIFKNNENLLGIKLSITMLLLIIIPTLKEFNIKKTKLLFYLPIPFIFPFMLETGSRVAFISFFLGLSLFYLLWKNISLKKVFRLALFSTVMISVWILFVKNFYLAERMFDSIMMGDLSGREVRWATSMEIFLENYLFGIGETGFDKSIVSYLEYYSSPHNVIIELLCYTGIVGLTFFIAFLFRVIGAAIKSFKDQNKLLALILLVPVFGLIISGQILATKIVWLIFTFVIISNSADFVAQNNPNIKQTAI